MATDYPYIQIRAVTTADDTATITVKIEEEFYGVDQQAVVDAVKGALQRDDLSTLTATKYEMQVTSTNM